MVANSKCNAAKMHRMVVEVGRCLKVQISHLWLATGESSGPCNDGTDDVLHRFVTTMECQPSSQKLTFLSGVVSNRGRHDPKR